VHTAYHGQVWCFERLWLPSPSGRRRLNVLGALDALTKELVTITNDTTISAPSICELLTQLAARSDGLPITVVVDNARYQKCALVETCAADLGIELLYLPSYSPQLNLIERLWRWLRKQCLYGRYYSTFATFCAALTSCLANAHVQHRAKFEDLFSWSFQSFTNVKLLPA